MLREFARARTRIIEPCDKTSRISPLQIDGKHCEKSWLLALSLPREQTLLGGATPIPYRKIRVFQLLG